ncbi:hypothetical protein C5S39_07015 [Candidatus Methanophagaceae archaeon]|jgi:hypothetical protein|nr:hypothetical protein C5S39_07015 [Methanophagales archaeon]
MATQITKKADSMSSGRSLRLTFSLALIPTGAVFVLLDVNDSSGQLISKIGLAFIVAGVISAFREIAILRLESKELGDYIVKKIYDLFIDFPLGTSGIRLVAHTRRRFDGFSTWYLARCPQKLFFAGRSVLHRIDGDFRDLHIGSAEEVIARRLEEGASITILSLDPRSDIIDRLAREENQNAEQMRSDLATSIGICKRLYDHITGTNFGPHAELHIRVYDEVPYFAYHREDDKVIVGFYFAPTLGWFSPAFEILDNRTRDFFERHFESIYNNASILLEHLPNWNDARFDEKLYNELYEALVNKLGRESN